MSYVAANIASILHPVDPRQAAALREDYDPVISAIVDGLDTARVISACEYLFARSDTTFFYDAVAPAARDVLPGWKEDPTTPVAPLLVYMALLEALDVDAPNTAALALALAIKSATLPGWANQRPPLAEAAESAMLRYADAERSTANRNTAVQAMRQPLRVAKAEEPEAAGAALEHADLKALLETTKELVRSLARAVDEVIVSNPAHRRLLEETDLLWWVLEPTTSRAAEPFEALGPAAVVVAAQELSDRLTFAAPVRGIDGLLTRVLRPCNVPNPVSLAAIADAAGNLPNAADWADELPVPCWSRPVLSALSMRARLGEGWAATLDAAIGLPAATTRPPVYWATQLVNDIALHAVLT